MRHLQFTTPQLDIHAVLATQAARALGRAMPRTLDGQRRIIAAFESGIGIVDEAWATRARQTLLELGRAGRSL